MKLTDNQVIFKDGIIVFPEDETNEPYLAASRCSQCGKTYYPRKHFCPECTIEEVEDASVNNEGILYTFTTVYQGVKGFKTPYLLGWIDFPEQKLRFAAQIDYDVAEAQAKLKPGQKVKMTIGVLKTLEDGTEVIGYKYKPVGI
ncbi:MAG: Zn-ribbon domain-containing OB-fold protein [Negativicutes bacterium]